MKKALTGIGFVLSCFVGMFVLLEFHENYLFVGIAALLLLVSSFFFLNALFAEKSKEWGALKDIEEEGNKRGSSGSNKNEFQVKMMNYMEVMNNNQVQMLQELKSQKQLLKNLEDEISSLGEQQKVQTKMVVKYNKENAKQVALNEKKVIGQAVNELKEVMSTISLVAPSVAVTKEETIPVMPQPVITEEVVEVPPMEEIEIPEEIVEVPPMKEIEIPEEIVEVPPMEEIEIPQEIIEVPAMEEMSIPEELMNSLEESALSSVDSSEQLDELVDLPSMEDFDLPVLDDIVAQEEPVAPVVDSDPNKMMTPDDIAKLLASMGI